MIELTKLNGTRFILNCDLIETIQENPDTTIYTTGKQLYIVRESMEEIVQKTIAYRRALQNESK